MAGPDLWLSSSWSTGEMLPGEVCRSDVVPHDESHDLVAGDRVADEVILVE